MQSKGKFSKLSAHIGEVNIFEIFSKLTQNNNNQSINQSRECMCCTFVVFIDDLTIQYNSNCVLQ